jgi:hypothetical protein
MTLLGRIIPSGTPFGGPAFKHSKPSFWIDSSPAVACRGLVFQRDLKGMASVPISGTCSGDAQRVEARALAADDVSESTSWTAVDGAPFQGSFSGDLALKGGWYRLEVRELAPENLVRSLAVVERIGVGEVFIVVGHSVAQGGDINLEGATDERARTIALSADETVYLRNTRELPIRVSSRRWLARPLATVSNRPIWSRYLLLGEVR